MTAPLSHIVEATKLTADAEVYLYRLDLRPSGSQSVYLKSDETVFWQGQIWEGLAIAMSGVGRYADEKFSRPRLVLQNPDGIFSKLISQGALDGADVVRFKVLKGDLDRDRGVYQMQSWWIARVVSLSRVSVQCELREQLDGPNFILPAHTYSPPEFPTVTIR